MYCRYRSVHSVGQDNTCQDWNCSSRSGFISLFPTTSSSSEEKWRTFVASRRCLMPAVLTEASSLRLRFASMNLNERSNVTGPHSSVWPLGTGRVTTVAIIRAVVRLVAAGLLTGCFRQSPGDPESRAITDESPLAVRRTVSTWLGRAPPTVLFRGHPAFNLSSASRELARASEGRGYVDLSYRLCH